MIVKYIKQVMNIPRYSDLLTYSREIMDVFPYLTKTFTIGFFRDTVQARFFKLSIIATLLWVYQSCIFDDLDLVAR